MTRGRILSGLVIAAGWFAVMSVIDNSIVLTRVLSALVVGFLWAVTTWMAERRSR